MTKDAVRVFVSHVKAHADELYAMFEMKTYGEATHRGATTAGLFFWKKVPEGLTAEKCAAQGHQLFGLGYGDYDDHLPPGSGSERKEGECCATLVAKVIGCDSDPVVQEML